MTLAHFGLRAGGDVHDVDAVRNGIGIATAVGRNLIRSDRDPARVLMVVAQPIALAVVPWPRSSDRWRRRAGRGDGHAATWIGDEGPAGKDDEASAAGRARIDR